MLVTVEYLLIQTVHVDTMFNLHHETLDHSRDLFEITSDQYTARRLCLQTNSNPFSPTVSRHDL